METMNRIVATIVPDNERLAILPRYFGGLRMLRAERLVYEYMRLLVAEYDGGFWNFYTLSNGGFYMTPDMAGPVSIAWEGNGFSASGSPDAAGVAATLFAISNLCLEQASDALAELFHQLRDYAAEHAESSIILGVID